MPKTVEMQKKVDELIKSGQRHQMIGTVLAVMAILIVVAAIPYYIYADRKKKARKQAEKRRRDGASAAM